MEPTSIYVLSCEEGKFYIGKTVRTVNERILEHIYGQGSDWTRRYKPIKVIAIFDSSYFHSEDTITIDMMSKFGIDNVRGGSFSQLHLSEERRETILAMYNSATDRCFKCGGKGHFANKCRKSNKKKPKIQKSKNKIVDDMFSPMLDEGNESNDEDIGETTI
jgi:hypothetical protein